MLTALLMMMMTPAEDLKKGIDAVHEVCYVAYEEYRAAGDSPTWKKVMRQAPNTEVAVGITTMCAIYARGRLDEEEKKGVPTS